MKRKSKQEWLDIIQEFERSGLNQAAFCQAKGLRPNYFSLKRSRLLAKNQPATSGFVKASVSGPAPASIKLNYGPVQLQFCGTTPPETIAAIAKALA